MDSDGRGSLADEESLTSLARAFDEAEAYAVELYKPGSSDADRANPPGTSPCDAGLARPDAFAIGAADDNGPMVLLALSYDTPHTAATNSAPFEHWLGEWRPREPAPEA